MENIKGNKPLRGRCEKFCQLFASGLYSLGDAYIKAGYEARNSSKLASRMSKKVDVIDRISYLQQKEFENSSQDVKRVKNYLRSIIDSPDKSDTAKLKAAELLGKSAGMYTEKANITHGGSITYRWEE